MNDSNKCNILASSTGKDVQREISFIDVYPRLDFPQIFADLKSADFRRKIWVKSVKTNLCGICVKYV